MRTEQARCERAFAPDQRTRAAAEVRSALVTQPVRELPDADVPDAPSPEPHAAILVTLFAVVAVGLTFPNLAHFRTSVGGDSGDSLLNLWIMRSVQHGLPHGWHTLWSPPVFYPAKDVLAYSDTLLPVALVHWPLRHLVGDATAFNAISLSAWVLCSWCLYRLARRVTQHWGAAFVAALAFTYSAMRLAHQQHFQLVVGGALATLVLLLLFRLLESPGRGRAIALGLSFAATTLTASYYGAMLGVVVLIVAAGWVLTQARAERRATIVALAIAALTVAVLVIPVGAQYVRLQRHPEFRRGFEPASAAHLDDFLSTGAHNYVLDHVPAIGTRSKVTSRGVENRLFPGFVAFAFGIAGAVVLAREWRRRRLSSSRVCVMVLVVAAGLACLLLALGDWKRVHGHRVFLPFIVFRHFVPGFAGIRAVARFALVSELALTLLAAVGIDALLVRLRPNLRVIASMGLAALVCAEAAMGLIFVRVPTARDDGGVDVALRARPRGVVLELPAGSTSRGAVWPYTESPRQLAALRDGHPRINGYSGFQPKNFDAEVATLNKFPSAAAIAEARRLGVRYIVLRTALVGPVTPRVIVQAESPHLARDKVGIYSEATAAQLLKQLPPGVAKDVQRLDGGYLVDIGQ
jgi:hypothetical protein